MEDFSRLTKKEIVKMYESVNALGSQLYFFILTLGFSLYNLAESEIDQLPVTEEVKDNLRKMCKILEEK